MVEQRKTRLPTY